MIRIANEKDYRPILEITNDVILNSNAIYREEPHTMESRTAWYKEKEDKNIPIYVYEQDGQVVGFITYGSFRDNPGYRFTVEHSLHVRKDARGQGIGEALLRHLIEDLKSSDIKTLVGVIDSQNSISRHLHEKCGFSLSGTLPTIALKNGQWLDVCFYTYTYA